MSSSKRPTTAMPAKAGPEGMHSYFFSYPLFCAATDGQGLVITGGGGGGKAYGVLNFLQAHVVIVNTLSGEPTLETIASMDTGAEAAVALDYSGHGFWACALGTNVLLFKFNDDTLRIEPVLKFSVGTNPNFVKIIKNSAAGWKILTGGEDKLLKVWQVDAGLSCSALVCQRNDHGAEIGNADGFNGHILTCGRDGTVKVYLDDSMSVSCSIQPRSPDPKLQAQSLSIRAAFFLPNQEEIVLLCHLPRGPSYLMLYSLSNPATPKTVTLVDPKSITPSMGINAKRDQVVLSHVGGEKDIYGVPALKLVKKSKKHCHEMPPGNCMFVEHDLVLTASPDFSVNFFSHNMRSKPSSVTKFVCTLLLILLLVLTLAAVFVALYLPNGRAMIADHVNHIISHPRVDEL